MNRPRIAITLLSVALLAVFILQAVLFRRIQQLEERLDTRQEEARRRPPVRGTERASVPAPPGPGFPERGALSVMTTEPAPAAETPEPSTPAAAPDAPLPRNEVEQLVRRMIREEREKSPLGRGMNFTMEDPMKVMERELKLSPAQILRIKEHRKARRESFMQLDRDTSLQSDLKGYAKRFKDAEEAYHDAVKRELDFSQQKKYEDLRKSGKLMDLYGEEMMITTTVVDSPPGNPPK